MNRKKKEATKALQRIVNDDFSNVPLKVTFSYEDVVAPWKRVARLEFLLALSITANLIWIASFLIKQFL